ncbi:MAG: hypothetical protein P8123_10190, partial [bacterium]
SQGFPTSNVRFLNPGQDLEAELSKARASNFRGSAIFAEDDTVRRVLEKEFQLADVKRFTGRGIVFVNASITAR